MKVGIVTGTRADYGLLEPLIRKVKNHRKMELQLYVTGMHLADRFGQTEKQIKHPVTCTIPVPIEATTTDEMGKATSYMLEGFLDEFGMRKPQIVFVLGGQDRDVRCCHGRILPTHTCGAYPCRRQVRRARRQVEGFHNTAVHILLHSDIQGFHTGDSYDREGQGRDAGRGHRP